MWWKKIILRRPAWEINSLYAIIGISVLYISMGFNYRLQHQGGALEIILMLFDY
jgi:hypothetical protein